MFQLDQLAPGVLGYTVDRDGALYVPIVFAESPGSGDVSRYLDSLPHDRTVKFPCVISKVLRGALQRRGFLPVVEWAEEADESVEVYVRHAQAQ